MTLFYLALSWLAGVAVANRVTVPWYLWLVLGIPALAGLILARARPIWRAVFGCALLFALGAARLTVSIPRFDQNDLASYNDQGFVTAEGVIVDDPEVRDAFASLRVQVEALTLADGQRREVPGLVLVQTAAILTYHYGDRVVLHGELRTPPEYEDYSYREALAREGIASIMQYTQVSVIGERQGSPIRSALSDFRAYAHQVVKRLLPDPQASLLAGILLGIKAGISPDVYEAFSAVGATHVIVISGSNLVIVAGLIQSLARRVLRERWAAAVTIAGVLIYTVFVGGDPAVMRAAIMTTLALIATQLGRQTYGMASLGFAALLMTLINPSVLWDVGFQLSFLATLGLILYVAPLQNLLVSSLLKVFSKERARQVMAGISDAFVVTIAAQITTTPIIALYFGRLSLLSLPVNFLIIPAQTPLMVFGGLAVIAALVFWPLGQGLAWLSWLFLSYTLWVVRTFAGLPFASAEVSNISPELVGGVYILMFGLTAAVMQPPKERARWWEWLRQSLTIKAVASVGLLLAILLLVASASLPDGRLHVSFVDVGDGAATLIVTPSGRHILVDAGGGGRQLSAALGDALPFWDRRLDLVILTQPTRTHMAGLQSVLERYHVDAVMTNSVQPADDLAGALWASLDAQGAQMIAAQPGMRVNVGDGVTLTVLHTQIGSPPQDDPGEPISLLVSYGLARILLPGDLTQEGAAALLDSDLLPNTTLLHVPTGARDILADQTFIQAASPQIVVLSVGGSSGSPVFDATTLARLENTGASIYRTDEAGSIWVITDGRRLWVETAR